MAAKKKLTPKRAGRSETAGEGKSEVSEKPAPEAASRNIGHLLWLTSAALFGMLISWSFLAPQDATSAFVGDAQAQNLFWLLAAVSVATGAASVGGGIRLPRWERWLGLACVAWIAYGSWRAGFENNARTAWYGFWQCMALVSCYYVGRGVLQGVQCRAAALQVCLLGCYALAVLGIYQVAIEFPNSRAAYAADADKFLQQTGLEAPVGSVMRKRFEDRLSSPEPHATFALANSLAVVLSAGLLLALGGASLTWLPRQTPLGTPAAAKWLVLLGVGVVGVTWFLTLSRTAYLAVLLAMGVWGASLLIAQPRAETAAARERRWRSVRAIGQAAVGVGLVAGAGGLWLWFNNPLVLSEALKSLAFRLDYWRATLSMLAEHGWNGVGLGNFQSYYPQYMLPSASETIADPHNWLLDIAGTLSVPIAAIVALWLMKQLWGGAGRAVEAGIEERVEASWHVDLQRDAELARCITGGAAGGGAICLVMLVLLSGFNFASLSMAALFAIALGWGTRGWLVELAQRPTGAVRAAAVAMVIALLVSGSWQASGIAVPLLILLICLRGLPDELPPASPAELPMAGRLGWQVRVATVGLPLTALLAFIWQSWLPVTSSWSHVQQAAVARSMHEQLELARLAEQADPLDSDRAQFVVQLLIARAMAEPAGLFPRSAESAWEALNGWAKRDSTNFLTWQFAGDRALELAAQAERNQSSRSNISKTELSESKYLQGAAEFYRLAISRYPTNCQLHVQLASVLALQEDWAGAHSSADIAEQLSEKTPHLDRKLAVQQVWLPLLSAAFESLEASQTPRAGAWYSAELVVTSIRNAKVARP